MAILEINNVASGYGEVQILWGSSLKLEEGKTDLPGWWQWGWKNYLVANSNGFAKTVGRFYLVLGTGRQSPTCLYQS